MQQVVKALFALTITQGKHTCNISKDDIFYVDSNKFVKNGVIVDIRDFPGAFQVQAGPVPSKYPIMEFTADYRTTDCTGKTTLIAKGTQFIKYDTVELINGALIDMNKVAFCIKKVEHFRYDANLVFDQESYATTVGQTVATSVTKDTDGAVTYESSDEAVATVDETGTITGVGAGTATIKAKSAQTSDYNAGEATCTVTIS